MRTLRILLAALAVALLISGPMLVAHSAHAQDNTTEKRSLFGLGKKPAPTTASTPTAEEDADGAGEDADEDAPAAPNNEPPPATAFTAPAAPSPAAPAVADTEVTEGGGVMSEVTSMLTRDALGFVWKLLLALVWLLAGWLAAKLISWIVFRALLKTSIDNWLADKLGLGFLMETEGDDQRVERITAAIVYYLLMLLVLIGVLQTAGLTQVAGPIQGFLDTVVQAFPLVVKAGLILGASWILGRVLEQVVSKALDRFQVDDRFAELSRPTTATEEAPAAEAGEAAPAQRPFSQNAGRIVFWLAMVVGLAGAFEALQIGPLAEPLRNAMDQVIGFLPHLGVSALILVAGYVFGRIARTVVTNLLESFGVDRLATKIKIDKLFGTRTASDVAGLVVMAFIVLQALIATLNELGLETLSEPLTDMMARFWLLLPDLVVSAIVLAVGVVAGRILRGVVQGILRNIGFDKLLEDLGLGKVENTEGTHEPSEIVGRFVQIGIVLVAIAQVLENLSLDTWSGYVNAFLSYAVTNLAVSALIVLLGFVISGYVRNLIASRAAEGDDTQIWIANLARYGVLVFAVTMAIRHLEVADDFVLISFALLFGSLCFGVALAFGLGARDVAAEIVRKQYDRAQAANAKAGDTAGDQG